MSRFQNTSLLLAAVLSVFVGVKYSKAEETPLKILANFQDGVLVYHDASTAYKGGHTYLYGPNNHKGAIVQVCNHGPSHLIFSDDAYARVEPKSCSIKHVSEKQEVNLKSAAGSEPERAFFTMSVFLLGHDFKETE
ncbi:hypothetical protein [Roseibium sp.]|uniref:hypothetical protein n=1 Tax=Roseibium sp. TaxID=1936156 RepID=UPI003B52997F